MMEIKDFVKETLNNIIQGVKEAQDMNLPLGATIIPRGLNYDTSKLENQGYNDFGEISQTISFDLAVVVTEEATKGGKIGIQSILLNADAGAQSSNSSTYTNRVRFCVPVLFRSIKLQENQLNRGQE
jgi:hypothetical protein